MFLCTTVCKDVIVKSHGKIQDGHLEKTYKYTQVSNSVR